MKPELDYEIELRKEQYMIEHYNEQISASEKVDLFNPGTYISYTFPMNQYNWRIEIRFDKLLNTYCIDITTLDSSSIIIDKFYMNYTIFRNFILEFLDFIYTTDSIPTGFPFNFSFNSNGFIYFIRLDDVNIEEHEVDFKESVLFDMVSGCLRDKELSIYKKEYFNDIIVPVMKVRMSRADITDLSIILNNIVNRLKQPDDTSDIIEQLIGYMIDTCTIPY